MFRILSVDPGQWKSGVIIWDGQTISFQNPEMENEAVIEFLKLHSDVPGSDRTLPPKVDLLVVEKIVSYMARVGESTFESAYWTGRFEQAWIIYQNNAKYKRIPTRDIKIHLCGGIKGISKKSIRAALIDRWGEKGTKKNPGLTYGLSDHTWSAFALAVYAYDEWEQEQTKQRMIEGWKSIDGEMEKY